MSHHADARSTDSPTISRSRRRRRRALITLGLAVLAGGIFRRPLFQHNLGRVGGSAVYRSAQPQPQALERWIAEYKLASVLNLRGGSIADSWYAGEVRVTREKQVEFYDLPMSAVRRPSRRELLRLIDFLERCRYPLLIHCKWGSDRTGLVSALYLMVRQGRSPSEALATFSIQHGHFPIFGPEHLQEPLSDYDSWLRAQHLTHTLERFRGWVENDYKADDPPGPFAPLRPGPRPQFSARPLPALR